MLMFKFWTKDNKKPLTVEIKSIAKQQLDQNRAVFQSLKEYDEGKKEIPTTNVRKHLRDLQPSL